MADHWQCVFKLPKNVKRKCVEFSFLRIGFNRISGFSVGPIKAVISLASAVRAEKQLRKASSSQNVISKRSFNHMIYLYCFSMVQSVLIHMQNPEREDKEKRRRKPKAHDSEALQRPRKCLGCTSKAF